MESCNTLSNRVCILNKTEDLNLDVFNIITRISESKTLTKHISWKCKCKFDSRKWNSNQKRNNDKCRCECKNPKEHHACEKKFIWDSATCTCEYGKYVGSIIDDSLITFLEIVYTTKRAPTTNFNKKS